MFLQAALALKLVVSLLKLIPGYAVTSILSAVMPRSPAHCLTSYGIPSYTHHLQGPKVREHTLLQLFILNEYAARYAIARHYLDLVDVDE